MPRRQATKTMNNSSATTINSNHFRKCRKRRGIVLIAVLVVFTIGLTLFGIWTHAALAQHRRLQTEHMRLQTARLAEAGLRRAVLRRASDPQYEGEVWQVPADAFGKSRTARVTIQVNQSAGNRAMIYEAVAQFPASAKRRAQVTKRIEVPSSATGEGQ
jgi:hypothetical protein